MSLSRVTVQAKRCQLNDQAASLSQDSHCTASSEDCWSTLLKQNFVHVAKSIQSKPLESYQTSHDIELTVTVTLSLVGTNAIVHHTQGYARVLFSFQCCSTSSEVVDQELCHIDQVLSALEKLYLLLSLLFVFNKHFNKKTRSPPVQFMITTKSSMLYPIPVHTKGWSQLILEWPLEMCQLFCCTLYYNINFLVKLVLAR